jgi:competence protein ComEA
MRPPAPPPFVLPPDGWRARLDGVLAGAGRQATVIALLALAALVGAGVLWLRAAPRPAAPPVGQGAAPTAAGAPLASLPRATTGTAGAATAAQPGGLLAVDVAGAVRHAGLLHLEPGSRVADAIRAAGGALPGANLDAVNLARKLVDGEQILVPAHGQPPLGITPGGAAPPTGPLDLNTATAEQLDTLPGVGPATARRIVDYRSAHPFASVEELKQVPGIGERRYEVLKDLVTVG